MPKGVKGFQKGHSTSEATRIKIGQALKRRVSFKCDYCGKVTEDKASSFLRKKRHYCSRDCYSEHRKTWPPEEHYNYGTGFSEEERKKRVKTRLLTNKAISRGELTREPCETCGNKKTEAHHDDYDKPYDIRWLCFECHRKWHKENPELLND